MSAPVDSVLSALNAAAPTAGWRSLDRHLGLLCASLDERPDPAVAVAAAQLSAAVGEGHVCLPLAVLLANTAGVEGLPADAAQWRARLSASAAVSPARGGAALVRDGGDRLYLARQWSAEQRVAARLRLMLREALPIDEPAALDTLDALFGPADAAAPDWQRAAVATALVRRACVITGGPGTGKTHTVARLLVAAQQLAERPLSISLAAPTGKAAARLGESISAALSTLGEQLPETFADAVQQLPSGASTLHRLLGYRPGRGFTRGADKPLGGDWLIVDEASMLDLQLFDQMLGAVPPGGRLVLLGDRDQLASVEAGNVLGDLVGERAGRASPAMRAWLGRAAPGCALDEADGAIDDAICALHHSYRFVADSAFGRFALAVNRGDWALAQAALQAGVSSLQHDAEPGAAVAEALAHARRVRAADSPAGAVAAMGEFQLLCALRHGPSGVAGLNAAVMRGLREAGEIGPGALYRGQPILIERNAPSLGLFNGDLGLIWPDARGELQAWFALPGGQLRAVAPLQLPPHQCAHAMTVHKTQGSEYQRVALVMPDEAVPLLGRQLLYTAVTRARESVSIHAPVAVLQRAIETRVERHSGLGEALARAGAGDRD